MKNKTKILIATPLYPPQVGGPATRTALLEKKFPDKGFIISVVKFSTVLRFPKVIRHFLYFLMVLFKGLSADIILAQDPVSTGLPALIASKILGKKFILIIVGDYAWEQGSQRAGVTDFLDTFSVESDKYPLFVRIFKKVQLFVANGADKVIVPSHYLRKIITNWGVNPNKINVIYNSFDAPAVSLDKGVLREKLGLSGHILVSAGRLVPWKGFTTLITKVMPKVLAEFSDAKLIILGEGPDKTHLENLIKDRKLENNVFLAGRKPQAELFEYIKAADVFVLNTAYEGMSHQLLEVMALETPIVTTNIGGNLEIIIDGDNGLLNDYNDESKMAESILKIFKDSDLAQNLAVSGKDRIKEFSESKMLSELAENLK